jgi:ATP/maltotriose-dependent transcriptional regulator MalT
VLRALPDDVLLERLPALKLVARARASLEDEQGARLAQVELDRIAERLDTPYLRARARLVAGELAAASGDYESARQACEDAVDCFTVGSAPYEAAVARLELAHALSALGHIERAGVEARAAQETFAALGAARDLARAEGLVADSADGRDTSNVASGSEGDDPGGELSPRELEVLALVAQGLGDAEIAERLVVSPHTVHRHVANIRAKLRLSSRAAAVAYAAREGLL